MKSLLTVIVIILLPLSVYGFDWTVSYYMKKSDGSYEFLELSVPKVFKDGILKIPHSF